MQQTDHGFTLIELLIVTAFISILAGIAVPNVLSSQTAANERAIVATLRTIATAQAQVMGSAPVDEDHDGIGEALSLVELAGRSTLRGAGVRLEPTALTRALGETQANGYVTNKGYLIALYLPDAAGTGILGAPANFANVDPDLAETSWTCLAWPVSIGSSGKAAFFVNQQGDVLTCRTADYSGVTQAPPAGAALSSVPPSQITGGRLAINSVGADGNTWLVMQ